MKATDITTSDVHDSMRYEEGKIRPRYDAFCALVGSCEECDKKIRFWCKVRCKIQNHQTIRIIKICRKNEKRIMRTRIEHCPLCSHEAKLVRVGDNKDLFIVRCSECGLELAPWDMAKVIEGDAIYLWNDTIRRLKQYPSISMELKGDNNDKT